MTIEAFPLIEILSFLKALHADGTRPPDGVAQLRKLNNSHAATSMSLLWEQQDYDQSYHYDILLKSSNSTGTVTIGFCPDNSLPWPLRGIHRWREADLLRVNTKVMGIQQAISCLDFIWNEAPISNRLVNTCLIEQAIEEMVTEPLSDQELQTGVDGFRRSKQLLTADETSRWMTENGLTQEKLEDLVADNLFIAKLRDKVVSDSLIEAFFEQNRSDFDSVYTAEIHFPDQETAQAAYQRILGFEEFLSVAQEVFLSTGNPKSFLFSHLRRYETHASSHSLFEARAREIVGPVQIANNDYTLTLVILNTAASLDEATRLKIKQVLFDNWLTERRKEASIEWYWGVAR